MSSFLVKIVNFCVLLFFVMIWAQKSPDFAHNFCYVML